MAIIDILTHYDAKKKAAHAAKTVKHGVSLRTTSSCVSLLLHMKEAEDTEIYRRICVQSGRKQAAVNEVAHST